MFSQKMSWFIVLMIIALHTNHPFTLVSLLLVISALVGFMSGHVISKWLFISIMMIFLGGMMILFFYLVSLTTPLKFKDSLTLEQSLTLIIIFFMIQVSHNKLPQLFILSQLYASTSSQTLMMLVVILLVCLVIVVKLTENFKGGLTSTW